MSIDELYEKLSKATKWTDSEIRKLDTHGLIKSCFDIFEKENTELYKKLKICQKYLDDTIFDAFCKRAKIEKALSDIKQINNDYPYEHDIILNQIKKNLNYAFKSKKEILEGKSSVGLKPTKKREGKEAEK